MPIRHCVKVIIAQVTQISEGLRCLISSGIEFRYVYNIPLEIRHLNPSANFRKSSEVPQNRSDLPSTQISVFFIFFKHLTRRS